ncbi:homocysteine S-methyltransferase family protein [Candidatus Gracilibacteria bacterium]|nr:homocysteine S-methyltransferase family protein [Candidatus Gracilibacteria bacterium]
MSRLLETQVSFGPYGTVFEDRGPKIGIPDLDKSANILNGGRYREEHLRLAQQYLQAGARVATTNTFGARHALKRNDLPLYRELIEAHVDVVREALQGTKRRSLAISFGPYGTDCYNPEDAPAGENESRDFHAEQFAVARELWEKAGIDVAVAETISTGREGLGVVLAAQKLGLPVIPSFVIDKDANLFDGEPLVEALKRIDAATGASALGYGINCCPIEGAETALSVANGMRHRILMVYPNASSEDPRKLQETQGVVHLHDHEGTAKQIVEMVRRNPSIRVVGGCCGYDQKAIRTLAHHAKGERVALR